MPARTILVDGSSFIFKAWHAIPGMTAPDGQPTGAVRGFVNMLEMLMKEYADTEVAVVFDAPGPTFRHQLYPQYKAQRPPMPQDLRSQLPLIHQWVRARGLPLFMQSGMEADDILATLADGLADRPVLILSQDKDMAQCVTGRVSLLRAVGEQPMGPKEVADKYGIAPERFCDFLALTGDASDGIPGVKGIGPGKATRLLAAHGTLQGVMDAAADLPGKDGEMVRQALPQLLLYLELVTVRRDVPVDMAAAVQSEPDAEALQQFYVRLGFSEGRSEEVEDRDADLLSAPEPLQQWLAAASEAESLALLLVPDDPDKPHSPTVGVALCAAGGRPAYVPLVRPDGLLSDDSACAAELLDSLQQGLQAGVGRLILPDAAASRVRAAELNLQLPEEAQDPLLMSYLLNPTAGRHQLEPICQRRDIRLVPYRDRMGRGANRRLVSALSAQDAGRLAGSAADAAVRLEQKLSPELQQEKQRYQLYRELELPLAAVLAEMQSTGVLVDCDMLRRHSQEMSAQTDRLRQRAWEIAEGEFNLDSPSQIGQVLFEHLALPRIGKTRSGQPSTAENVLQQLAEQGEELPAILLEYRGLRKLISTYADKLPQQVNPRTGRIHTTYHQATTSTGRLSSTDPNLQNIPIRTAEGRRIRHAFCAPEGSVLIAADYSQIELRVMAHLSEDEALLQAFAIGSDIHSATAEELFGAADAEGRRRAKAINFGLMYGMSAFGLARELKVPQHEAARYLETYFARFPGVQRFMDKIRTQAGADGYVETLWGRRLYLPEIRTGHTVRRQAAERAAINAPMQGTAADIIKRAMLSVRGWLQAEGRDTGGRLLMQVHDELVLEVPEDCVQQVTQALIAKMAAAAELKVPLVVDVGVGPNWEEAKKS